jgi:hypothetical protein
MHDEEQVAVWGQWQLSDAKFTIFDFWASTSSNYLLSSAEAQEPSWDDEEQDQDGDIQYEEAEQ